MRSRRSLSSGAPRAQSLPRLPTVSSTSASSMGTTSSSSTACVGTVLLSRQASSSASSSARLAGSVSPMVKASSPLLADSRSLGVGTKYSTPSRRLSSGNGSGKNPHVATTRSPFQSSESPGIRSQRQHPPTSSATGNNANNHQHPVYASRVITEPLFTHHSSLPRAFPTPLVESAKRSLKYMVALQLSRMHADRNLALACPHPGAVGGYTESLVESVASDLQASIVSLDFLAVTSMAKDLSLVGLQNGSVGGFGLSNNSNSPFVESGQGSSTSIVIGMPPPLATVRPRVNPFELSPSFSPSMYKKYVPPTTSLDDFDDEFDDEEEEGEDEEDGPVPVDESDDVDDAEGSDHSKSPSSQHMPSRGFPPHHPQGPQANGHHLTDRESSGNVRSFYGNTFTQNYTNFHSHPVSLRLIISNGDSSQSTNPSGQHQPTNSDSSADNSFSSMAGQRRPRKGPLPSMVSSQHIIGLGGDRRVVVEVEPGVNGAGSGASIGQVQSSANYHHRPSPGDADYVSSSTHYSSELSFIEVERSMAALQDLIVSKARAAAAAGALSPLAQQQQHQHNQRTGASAHSQVGQPARFILYYRDMTDTLEHGGATGRMILNGLLDLVYALRTAHRIPVTLIAGCTPSLLRNPLTDPLVASPEHYRQLYASKVVLRHPDPATIAAAATSPHQHNSIHHEEPIVLSKSPDSPHNLFRTPLDAMRRDFDRCNVPPPHPSLFPNTERTISESSYTNWLGSVMTQQRRANARTNFLLLERHLRGRGVVIRGLDLRTVLDTCDGNTSGTAVSRVARELLETLQERVWDLPIVETCANVALGYAFQMGSVSDGAPNSAMEGVGNESLPTATHLSAVDNNDADSKAAGSFLNRLVTKLKTSSSPSDSPSINCSEDVACGNGGQLMSASSGLIMELEKGHILEALRVLRDSDYRALGKEAEREELEDGDEVLVASDGSVLIGGASIERGSGSGKEGGTDGGRSGGGDGKGGGGLATPASSITTVPPVVAGPNTESQHSSTEVKVEGRPESAEASVRNLKKLLTRQGQKLSTHEQRLLSTVVTPANIPVKFTDLILPPPTKLMLQTIVTLPLLRPELFQTGVLSRHSISGVLLFGPPGTGKTMLAKAVARSSGARFMSVALSDVFDKYVGEGEKNVRAVFTLARKLAPCVVFMDEVDAIFGARRGDGMNSSRREIINEFMSEWDGLTSDNSGVIVMGATNRPFDLDDAILRRMPRRVIVDLPNEGQRAQILAMHLRDEVLDPSVSLASLASRTNLYSGSDLKNICVAAALAAVKETVVREHMSTLLEKNCQSNEIPSNPTVDEVLKYAESIEDWTDIAGSKLHIRPIGAASVPPVMPAAESSGATSDGNGSFKSRNESVANNESPSGEATAASGRRILCPEHFEAALREVPPSLTDQMQSLIELRKWNDQFGENHIGKSKKLGSWGFDMSAVGGDGGISLNS